MQKSNHRQKFKAKTLFDKTQFLLLSEKTFAIDKDDGYDAESDTAKNYYEHIKNSSMIFQISKASKGEVMNATYESEFPRQNTG